MIDEALRRESFSWSLRQPPSRTLITKNEDWANNKTKHLISSFSASSFAKLLMKYNFSHPSVFIQSARETANVDISAAEIFRHHRHAWTREVKLWCDGSALNNRRTNVDRWDIPFLAHFLTLQNKDFNAVWMNGKCLEQYLFKWWFISLSLSNSSTFLPTPWLFIRLIFQSRSDGGEGGVEPCHIYDFRVVFDSDHVYEKINFETGKKFLSFKKIARKCRMTEKSWGNVRVNKKIKIFQ